VEGAENDAMNHKMHVPPSLPPLVLVLTLADTDPEGLDVCHFCSEEFSIDLASAINGAASARAPTRACTNAITASA
jgi:hypothetical protein